MTQIEQHYKKAWEETFKYPYQSVPEQQKHIFKAMQEYAEYYAKKCLEVAADEVVVDHRASENPCFWMDPGEDVEYYAIRASITDIQLPKHV